MRNVMKLLLSFFIGVMVVLVSCSVDGDTEVPKVYFTVTFDSDGGSAVKPQTVESGQRAIEPEAPKKEGYTLSAWYNGSSAFAFSTPITADLTLKAKWKANSYKVTLRSNGSGMAISATYNEKMPNLSSIPVLENSEFGGYYTEPFAKGTKYIDSEGKGCHVWDIANDDTILYAAWGYKINYENVKGVTNQNPEIYTGEENLELIDLENTTGYNFLGWYDVATEGNKVTAIAKGDSGAKTLYAHWEAIPYTISYDLAGGELAEENPKTYTIESETITLNSPKKDGYSFTGWYADGKKYAEIPQGTTGNLSLTAEWSLITYPITYELNGGTNSIENPASYTSETSTITLKDAERAGYEFVGWYDAATEGNKVTAIAKGEFGAKTLYARWNIVTYTITYDLDGGTLAEENPKSYTIESETITLKSPKKDGYTFAGWYADGKKYTEILQGTTGNLSLTAKWNLIIYPITYELNGGMNSSENPATYTSETPTITLKDATKTGYEFVGWYDAATDGNKVTAIAKGEFGEKTLYARWNIVTYTITYDLDGGTVAEENPKSYTIESETFTLKSPKKDGYGFAGWYAAEKLYTQIQQGTSGNLVLKAKWSLDAYPITYELNGGTNSEENPTSYTSETPTITLKDAERTGYEFLGWYDAAMDGNKVTAIAKGEFGAKTLYARWKLITYTISYDLAGGALAEENPKSYTIESVTITLNSPKKDGYNFMGWYADEKHCTQIVQGTTGNLSFTAKWAVISYKINYELFGSVNSSDNPATYTIESPAITLKDATKIGYEFLGWYDAETDGNKITAIKTGEFGTKTLYSRWKIETYTITYDLDGGTLAEENPESYTIETRTITLNAPAKDGCTFAGWYANGTKYTEIPLGTSGNLALKAKWIAAEIYAITFNPNASDVTGSMTGISAYENTSVKLTENAFVRTGYTFLGWATSPNGTKVYDDEAQVTLTGNTILYAVWTEDRYVPYTVQHLLQNAEDDDYTLTATETKYGKILAQTNAQAKTYEHFTAAPIVQKKLPVEGTTYIQVLYDREIVTLRFDSANGDEVQSASGKWGASYTKPQEPERFGYTFKEWSPALPDTLESKTCTAQWTPIPYSISYEGIDGAENPNTSTAYTIESEITLQAAKKTGFTFLGWYDVSKKVTKIPLGSTGNITLTAQWKENALSPTVTLESVTSQIPTLAITLEAGTFTATGGFKSYLWKIDGKVAQNGSDNTYAPDASELSGGHHNITLFVTAEDGTYNSATAVFTVNK